MATFQELMRAAENAEGKGDSDAARQLVRMAESLMPAKPTADQNVAGTGNLTPKAYDPSENVSTPKVDRFGDTISEAIEAPLAATQAFARGVVDPSKSPTRPLVPEWVPGVLEGPVARVGDAAMAALSAAGTTYALGAGTVGEVFGGSPTQERKLARDLMMIGEVAVPELAGASKVMSEAAKTNRALRTVNKAPSATQSAARAADDLNITPSLASGGKVRAMTSAGLEKVPVTGGVIAKDAERFVEEVERAFNTLVTKTGMPLSASEAGDTLVSGLSRYVKNFKAKSNKLFSAVGDAVPDATVIYTPETVAAIKDAIAPFADKPAISKQLGLEKWAAIADDLEGGLTWRAASDLRSSIGESIGKINGELASMDQGKLKLAYSKLTADLESAAKAAGPEAERAWRRATNYYRRGAEYIEKNLDKTINANSPERAFEAFASMAKRDSAQADWKRLYRIKSSMERSEWDQVAASIVDRMGRAPAGQQGAFGDVFSPAKFLTEWNKISDDAKKVLLRPDVRKEMDQLAEVAAVAKAGNAERNFSNTGTAMGLLLTGAGGVADMGATAAALGTSFVSAKAFTSRPFLSALNRWARGDARAMKALAKPGSPFAQDAATVLRMSAADVAGKAGMAPANDELPPSHGVR